jgi:predicted N-acyltransferase
MRADTGDLGLQGDAAVQVRVHDTPASIDAAAWDALADAQPGATPFLRHAYLLALHASGSASR